MKGTNPLSVIVPVLLAAVILGVVFPSILKTVEEQEDDRGGDLIGGFASRFSIQSVRENILLVRNEGVDPIPKNALIVLVNGRQVSYGQSVPIEQYKIGELILPFVHGPCPVKIEVVSSIQVMSTNANLCVYIEDFDTDPQWNVSGASFEILNGAASIANAEGVGRAFDRGRLQRDVWVLEARVRGDSPEIIFSQVNGTGYVFGVSSRGVSSTTASFWVGDSKKDSHTYAWAWDPQKWYIFKVHSEGNGVYFGKVWADDSPEPQEWQVFLIDTTYVQGGVGVQVDTAGETMEVDYVKIYWPPAQT